MAVGVSTGQPVMGGLVNLVVLSFIARGRRLKWFTCAFYCSLAPPAAAYQAKPV